MTVIYADMVGDLFHLGHVKLLQRAKALGDILIVGVNSDIDVESYKRTPTLTLEERTAVIQACRYVDKAISPSPLLITEEFMNEHGIDMVVHAHDEDDTRYNEMYDVPMKLGKFKRLDYTTTISTTEIMQRIISRANDKDHND
jgi:cytidyltransferase-like protein